MRTRSSGSARRAIACLAAAISAAVICAKSFFCSTSRSETVSRSVDLDLGFVVAPVEAAEQRLLDALRARRRRLRRARRRAAAAWRRSAFRYSRACGKRCGRPDRIKACARAASRTPRAASSRNRRGRRPARPARLPARRAPRRAHRNPGGAQRPREVEDIFGEAAFSLRHCRSHPLVPAKAVQVEHYSAARRSSDRCTIRRAAPSTLLPSSRAMSS